jgi:hypothetical protein
MSKFVNVPRLQGAPQVASGLLQQQLDEQAAQQQAVPELQTTGDVPQPAFSGFNYEEDTSVPVVEEQPLFADDVYDKFGPDVSGEVYSDVELGLDRSIPNVMGEETPFEQVQALRQAELERQAAGPQSIFDLTRAKSEEEILNAFPDAIKPTQVGRIHEASRDLGLAMNTIEYTDSSGTKSSGLSKLSEGLGVTTRTAANLGTLSMTMLSPMIWGAANAADAEAIGNDPESSDSLTAIESLLSSSGEGGVELVPLGGGMTKESIENATGRLINSMAKTSNMVNEQGLPIDPETANRSKISAEESGAIAVQSQIDSGYYVEDVVEGIPIVRLNPLKGAEFYQNSRDLQRSVTDKLSGRAQKVPVTEYGDYIGALRNIREGDLKKPGYKATTQMAEAKRIAGSVAKMISPTKGYFGAQLFKVLLEQIESPDGTSKSGINALPFFKIDPKDLQAAKEGDNVAATVIKNKLNLAAGEFFYQAGFMADGSPNYTRYKEDYSTHRLYQDPVDFNEQRNKLTRATMVFTNPSFKMDNTTYHQTGVDRKTAGEFWNRIGAKARGKDFTMTARERELSFLATLARVLDIGAGRSDVTKTENLPVPDMMSLIDASFIQRAAFIGNQLRSLVPTSRKNVVNDILNIAAKVDAKFNEYRKNIPGSPNQAQEAFPELTEQQQQAINAWLNNSDRETWGYTLQGYLDAANYLDAKRNNTAFNPKVTVALDMNSAGRAFLAMDIGKTDILKRVGLMWEQYTDRELQDVVGGKGDPRAFFTSIAREQGIQSAFGDSDQEKVNKWKTILDQYGGKGAKNARKFNSDLSKKVLLTTDYGKPMAYHMEEARAFLKAYPSFTEEMTAFYNGDFKAVVHDLNQIFNHTLQASGDSWQYALPKQIVKVLQMFGRVPSPIGVYGENISIGRFGREETGKEVTIRSSSGKERKLALTRSMFDPEARAKDKGTRDEEGNRLPAPGPGTAAINQIGPVMGQYRESIVIAETLNYINGGKDSAKMLNMSPVFDNFIVDSQSYLQVMYVANNIIVPKVMEWDMAGGFADDFKKQLGEAVQQLKKEGTTITISNKSPYKGLLTVLDREYSYIKNSKDSDLSRSQLAFKRALMNDNSGYIPPEERPDTLIIKADQFMKLVNATLDFYNIAGATGKLAKWTILAKEGKGSAMSKVKDHARRGEVYFFT